jgi:hypothetical protein
MLGMLRWTCRTSPPIGSSTPGCKRRQSYAVAALRRSVTCSRAPRRYVDLCGADDWTVVSQSVVGATVALEGIVCAATVARSMASALARADQWSHPVSHVLAKELGLRSSAEALLAIHAPDRNTSVDELIALQRGVSWAHKSLGFEELPAVAVVLERATARILARGLISTAEDAG